MKDRLIELRKKTGLSQEELAMKLVTTRQAVSKWERGESMPSTENLIELSRFYKVSMDYIVGNEVAVYETAVGEAAGAAVSAPRDRQAEHKKHWLDRVFPMIVILIYMMLGFMFDLWHPAWMLFGLVPIYHAISMGVRAGGKRKAKYKAEFSGGESVSVLQDL